MMCLSDLILDPTLALIGADLGFSIGAGVDRLRSRVGGGWAGRWLGGRLVKSDFITHSGSNQSSVWIQNPS